MWLETIRYLSVLSHVPNYDIFIRFAHSYLGMSEVPASLFSKMHLKYYLWVSEISFSSLHFWLLFWAFYHNASTFP
jgi:hypothetical protein